MLDAGASASWLKTPRQRAALVMILDVVPMSRQDRLQRLHCSMESNFRTKALGRVFLQAAIREQASSPRMKVGSDDGAYKWRPEPRHAQERIGKLGFVGGEGLCEDAHRCGGQAEESGVEGVPEVDQPQLGRLEDSVRDNHDDNGHVHIDGRSDGKTDAGNALREADAFLEVQAGQSLSKAKVDAHSSIPKSEASVLFVLTTTSAKILMI